MNESQLVNEVLDVIVDAVNLHHLDRSTVNADTVLTQGGLGLDSVDVLEIVVAIEQKFGVKVTNAESGRNNFRTIGTIASFVQSKPGNC